jgi:formylmethanofuran dehydrogenase subunit E
MKTKRTESKKATRCSQCGEKRKKKHLVRGCSLCDGCFGKLKSVA